MFRQLTEWAVSLIANSRELSDHRLRLKHLEERVRDLEEGMRLMLQQLQHDRVLEAAEREKLFLKIEALAAKALPQAGRRRRKKHE